MSCSVYFLTLGTCAGVTKTGYLQVPVAYLQIPVPREVFLLIFKYLCLGKWFSFLLIFRHLCLGKCFFLSSGSSAGVSGTGYLQMSNKQNPKRTNTGTWVLNEGHYSFVSRGNNPYYYRRSMVAHRYQTSVHNATSVSRLDCKTQN